MEEIVRMMREEPRLAAHLFRHAPEDIKESLSQPIESFFEETKGKYDLMDVDNDGQVTIRDFRLWYRKRYNLTGTDREIDVETNPPNPCLRQLQLVALQSGIPFIGFGFLDNRYWHEPLNMVVVSS